MKKILLRIIIGGSILLGVYSPVWATVTAEKDNPSSPENNEVIINYPITDQPSSSDKGDEAQKGDDADKNKNNIEKPDEVVTTENTGEGDVDLVEELNAYLRKEQNYLQQLDTKYKSLFRDKGDEGKEEKDDVEAQQGGDKKTETVKVPQGKEGKGEGTMTGSLQVSTRSDTIPDGSHKDAETAETAETVEGKGEDKGKLEVDDVVDIDMGLRTHSSPFDMAEIFYEMGKYKEAMKEYNSIKKDSINENDFIWAQFQMGNCYRNLKRFDDATKAYQAFINNYPDSFWAEQASWYIKDAKWWDEWFRRIGTDESSEVSKRASE